MRRCGTQAVKVKSTRPLEPQARLSFARCHLNTGPSYALHPPPTESTPMPSDAPTNPAPKQHTRRSSKAKTHKHRRTVSAPRVAIRINIYDLLPTGHLSTCLWHLGAGLLHSGVVIDEREYAYGAHPKAGVSGVYYTRPGHEPPGGTFRATTLHGFTFCSREEIAVVIAETSARFMGSEWNLLKRNCNHFTSYLCEQLTGVPAPAWLNRAARIGVALPCIIPTEWLGAPDAQTADGELLQGDSDEDGEGDGERTGLMRPARVEAEYAESSDDEPFDSPHSSVAVRDTSGRAVPVSERAPV